MKNKIYKLNLSVVILILIATFFSCGKDEYLTDSGVHQNQTPYNTYDYLAAHPYHYFDTLLMIIDHYDLKAEVNNAGTFFAPTDRSINLYLRTKEQNLPEGDTFEIADLLVTLPADSVKQYMFSEKITKNSTSIAGDLHTSLGNTQITVKRTLQTDAQYYQWSTVPVYFLYYIKDVGLDEPTSVQCQTTDILTQNGNGTVLHVLRNDHNFVSFSN